MATVYKGICQHCGKEFESLVNPKNSNRRKFCSKGCSSTEHNEEYRAKHGLKKGRSLPNFKSICKECGKEFERYLSPSAQKKGQGLYCSNKCKSVHHWKDRKLTDADKTKTCEYCKKDFVYCGAHKTQRFCSLECANLEKIRTANYNDRNLTCERCGKEFVRNLTDRELKIGKGKYCSHECYSDRFAWVQTYCEQCGKPLKRGHGDRFCSHKCSGLAHRKKDGYVEPGSGYVFMTVGDGRRVAQHRYVMEQLLDRELYDWERVHHKNGRRNDNDPSNLEIWLNSHPAGQRLQDVYKSDVERLITKVCKLKQELEQLKQKTNGPELIDTGNSRG